MLWQARWSPSSMIAFVRAGTSQTLLTRRPEPVSAGVRTQTLPESLATSIAHTRCTICSNGSSRISSTRLITTSPRLLPDQYPSVGGLPGGLGRESESLTGVLEATVRDPAGSGPGARLIHGLQAQEKDGVGGQPA